jgi:tetrahydromethanopterin S-methyltransferase subunit G
VIPAETIARLKAEMPNAFGIVEGAAAFAALGTAKPKAVPAAYVFTDEEAAEANERLDGVSQRVETDVGVVLITSDVSDRRGAAASADVETLKRDVIAALVGWRPDSADDVMTYVGARLVRAREGLVTLEMTFATAFYVFA